MEQDDIKEAHELALKIKELEIRKLALSNQFRALGEQQDKIAERIDGLKGSIIGRGLFADEIKPNNLYRTRNGSVVLVLAPSEVAPGVPSSTTDVVVIKGGHGVEKTRGDKVGSTYFVQWREPTQEEIDAARKAEENDDLPDEIRKALARQRRHREDDDVTVNEAPDIWRLEGSQFVAMYGMGIVEHIGAVPIP